MPSRLSFKHAGAAFLFALCAGTASPALAGFQWIAPSDSVPAPVVVQQAPQVVATTSPEIISPVVITGSVSTAPAPVAMVAPTPLVTTQQGQPVTLSAAPTPAPMQQAAPVAGDNSVVLGFARSVPLAVALREILPSGYAFSIDQDVDMGTLVSFQGGRSWPDTLRDALSPVGLTMHQRGQMVQVGFAARDMMPAPAPAMTTAETHPFAAMPVAPPSSLPGVPATTYQVGTAPGVLVAPPATNMVPVPAPIISMGGPAAGNAGVNESWTAERGETLRKVLENWSRRANVEFDWFSEYDYPLEASVAFSGGFEGAVRGLLMGFEGAHPQPVAELHANSNLGQMVLVVQTRGNTNSD